MLGSNFDRNITAMKATKTRVTPLCPAPLLSDLTWIIYMVLKLKRNFYWQDRMKDTHNCTTLEQFHLGALSSASFLQLFFSFFAALNSGCLSASLTKRRRSLAVGTIQLERPSEPWFGGNSSSVVFWQPLLLPGWRQMKCASSVTLTSIYLPLAVFADEKRKRKERKKNGLAVQRKSVLDWGERL